MFKPKYMLVAISIVFASAVAATEIYKWTDENGIVHYSDTPGPNASQLVDINTPAPLSNAPPQPDNNTSTNANTSVLPQPTAAEKQQLALQQKQNEAFCQQAKQNVTLLQETGRRLYVIEPNGQYHWYNDEERQQALVKTQAEIQQYCTPSATGTPASKATGNTP